MDYENFENWGNDIFEARVLLLQELGRYCQAAVEGNDVKGAAYLQGQAASWVKRHAKIFRLFGDDMCHPVPLGLYEAAAECEDPLHALAMAVDIDYRKSRTISAGDDDKGTWSVKDLREHFDIVKKKREGKGSWLDCKAEVWQVTPPNPGGVTAPATVTFALRDFQPSGEKPKVVELRAMEVLEK